MPIYIRITSADWRDYPAVLTENEAAWHEAHPAAVQYGPLERIEIRDRGQTIIGYPTEGEPFLIAESNYDMGWILWGHVRHSQEDARMYDAFEIASEG